MKLRSLGKSLALFMLALNASPEGVASAIAAPKKAVNTITSPAQTEPRRYLLGKPLGLALSLEAPSLGITFRPDGDSKEEVVYQPNSLLNWGVGLEYEGYGATLTLPVASSEQDVIRKGETKHFDLILSRYWDEGGVDFFYAVYRGFYRDRGEATQQSTLQSGESPTYQQRPDLYARHIGGNFYHVFNPGRFKLKTPVEMAGPERVGGGSWLGIFGLDQYRIASSDPVLAVEKAQKLDASARFYSSEFLSATLGGGYGYAQTYGPQFFRLQLLMGFGPQWQKLEYERRDQQLERVMLGSKIHLGAEYSYSFESWRLGALLKYDGVQATLPAVRVDSRVYSALFYAKTQI